MPSVIPPMAVTSRSTSTHLLAASAPGDGPAGGGPAGRAPARRSRARSTADSRDGTVLIRHPPVLRCTVAVSIQKVTCCPARAVPSQNCCGPTVMFPDAGTTRSTSIASGQLTGSAAAGASADPGAGQEMGSRSAGAHSGRSSSYPAEGRNRAAGVAMSSDWCGRSCVVFLAPGIDRGLGASIEANGPASSRKSVCRVWCQRSTFPVVVGEYGLVSSCLMPFLRQIRSNSTSAGRGLPNRPVNCLPLSVRTSSGMP